MKDNLRDSLQMHVAPMLQPKKSTAELIHEKQTERANEESARVIKQNKHDLMMTNVQKISQEIDGHVQRMATLDNELLDLHAALQLQKPITEPLPPEGPKPTVQEMPPQAPDLLETMADDLDMTPRGLSEEDRDEGSSGASKKIRVCVPQDASDVESWVTGLPRFTHAVPVTWSRSYERKRNSSKLS